MDLSKVIDPLNRVNVSTIKEPTPILFAVSELTKSFGDTGNKTALMAGFIEKYQSNLQTMRRELYGKSMISALMPPT